MSDYRKAEDRLYERNGRWWADFRDYAEEGGGREGLVPEGERWATRDRSAALKLAAARLNALEAQRRANASAPVRAVRLWDFAPRYLQLRARETKAKKDTMARTARALKAARVAMRDANGNPYNPYMHEVTVRDVADMKAYLLNDYVSPRTGRPFASRSVRYATYALSQCFRYAAVRGFVPKGFDPVAELTSRASMIGESADFLEEHEAAAVLHMLIEHAGGIDPHVGLSFVAALTGCRKKEGAGLLTREVERERGIVVYRGNRWREIKTRKKGHRAVPIWPQLELFVEAYGQLFELSASGLYLPGRSDDGDETMITSVKTRLDAAQEAAADLLDSMGVVHQLWDRKQRSRLAAEVVPAEDLPAELREATVDTVVRTPTYQVAELRDEDGEPKHVRAAKEARRLRYKQARARLVDSLDEKRVTVAAWRPTYATARVQTLDHGYPVARHTVAGELGHRSNDLLDRVYGHVANARGPRREVVEYRLPDGSLPGEAFFREVLGSARVDSILSEHRFGSQAA